MGEDGYFGHLQEWRKCKTPFSVKQPAAPAWKDADNWAEVLDRRVAGDGNRVFPVTKNLEHVSKCWLTILAVTDQTIALYKTNDDDFSPDFNCLKTLEKSLSAF